MKSFIQGLTFFLLLVTSWLTFHDIAEPHSARDWLIVLSTILLLISFIIRRKKINPAV